MKEIDQKLFNVFAEQIFNTGFVHADPHSGNGNYDPPPLPATKNIFPFVRYVDSFCSLSHFERTVFLRKRSDGSPELVLLDHGLYEILPQAVRLSLWQFWEAIVLKDRTKMDRYAKELNVNGEGPL